METAAPIKTRSDKYFRAPDARRPVRVQAARKLIAVAWFWGPDAETNADEYVRFKNGVER